MRIPASTLLLKGNSRAALLPTLKTMPKGYTMAIVECEIVVVEIVPAVAEYVPNVCHDMQSLINWQ